MPARDLGQAAFEKEAEEALLKHGSLRAAFHQAVEDGNESKARAAVKMAMAIERQKNFDPDKHLPKQ